MSIIDRSTAARLIREYRENGKQIVFTNGCFDILHRGHIDYLKKAKQLGDVLVIGLNSDVSVKRLKGIQRPYQNEFDRAEVLNALRFVNLVVIFEEDTPLELICELKPDILVKGGDYEIHSIVGATEIQSWGGKVEIIPFLEGYGTSKLIDKIFGKLDI